MTIFGISAATFMASTYSPQGAQRNRRDQSCTIVGLTPRADQVHLRRLAHQRHDQK